MIKKTKRKTISSQWWWLLDSGKLKMECGQNQKTEKIRDKGWIEWQGYQLKANEKRTQRIMHQNAMSRKRVAVRWPWADQMKWWRRLATTADAGAGFWTTPIVHREWIGVHQGVAALPTGTYPSDLWTRTWSVSRYLGSIGKLQVNCQ